MSGRLQEVTARELAARNFSLQVSEAYPSVRLLAGALTIMVGAPGMGKSTMLAKFLDGVDGNVALFAAEEGAGPALGERLARLKIRRSDFHVFEGGNVDSLAERIVGQKIKVLGIDSLNVVQILPQELRRIQSHTKMPLVLATQQVTKAGLPAGSNMWSHEADCVFLVEKMTWKLVKTRYQATGLSGEV